MSQQRWTSQHDRSRSDTVMISMHFNSYASLAILFMSFLFFFCIFFFEHEPIQAIRVLTEFDFYYRTSACNLTERENLQYSDRPFRFVFGFSSITALSMFTNPCLVLLLLLAGLLVPKFFFQLTKKKLERSPGKGRTQHNLTDDVTALAQFYALYSDRAQSFNHWQRAL